MQPSRAESPSPTSDAARASPHRGRALIAATACAADLPLYTRNGPDFAALEDLVEVIVV
jgi:predicted nucleic acid-binding protein